MGTILISELIKIADLRAAGEELFGDMIKAVVDVKKEIMAAGAELHSDEEAFLLERQSRQQDLWGINLYTDRPLPDMIEFDSMINIRPSQNNRSRGIENKQIQEQIVRIVEKLVVL
jgi:Protein of unknown function (DUF5674)